MIEEAYVSEEIAKLLAEKGFNEPCTGLNKILCKDGEKPVMLITQQKAMRWLREKHNLAVEVYRTACGYVGCIVAIPSGTDIRFFEDDGDDRASGQYTTWEKVCEELIKYSLENLI